VACLPEEDGNVPLAIYFVNYNEDNPETTDIDEASLVMYNYEPLVITDYVGDKQEISKTTLDHDAIHQVVATRKDCFAICDVPSYLYEDKSTSAAVKAIQASGLFRLTKMTNE